MASQAAWTFWILFMWAASGQQTESGHLLSEDLAHVEGNVDTLVQESDLRFQTPALRTPRRAKGQTDLREFQDWSRGLSSRDSDRTDTPLPP